MPSTMVEDHPSVHTVQTPSMVKKRKSTHTGEVTSRQALKIAHQRVDLDIDLANQIIYGETEITVLPLEQSLKKVKFDCRNMQILEVFVNNKRSHFSHNDFHWNDEFLNNPDNYDITELGASVGIHPNFNPIYDMDSETFDIHQHHIYRSKFHPIYGNTHHLDELNINTDPAFVQSNYHHPYTPLLLTNTEDLIVEFPEGTRLKLQSNSSLSNFSPSRSTHATPFSTANTLLNDEQVYSPVQIRIKYVVRNPKNGIVFNGGLHTKVSRNEWCCYTNNNDVNFSTSCWVPCIDDYYEKHTWDLNISVPKTIGDIGESKIIGTKAAEAAMKEAQRREDDDYEDDQEDNSDIDSKREIIVISPELLNYSEAPHTTDFSKKIFNFQIYNPAVAQHVGFAVGPFESIPLVSPGEEEKDPEGEITATSHSAGANVPTTIYFLPGQRENVMNTCIFLYKAMDFYSKEFGSFPFNSYSLAFMKDMPTRCCGFAGLSIVSDEFIYSSDKMESIFVSTEFLATKLAEQWAGINVVPKTHNDIWCILGLAEFMSAMLSKKLFGMNEFKYRNKLKVDAVCEQDIRRPPLAQQFFRFPINNDKDFEFFRMKAALVMIILDNRMTKTDKSFGLSRVIPKLFLQAMSNDLFNGNCLSTYHFKHVCEKVNHNRLDSFFKNWVYSAGTPTFRITQKFNRKKMVIELTVRQVQVQELSSRETQGPSANLSQKDERFIDDALNFIESDESEHNVPAIFQGPMTVRVHEADGTPYEHIVELKDGVSRLEVPYNTKYRRLKRGKRKTIEISNEDDGNDDRREQFEEVKFNCLGDVLKAPDEMDTWNLQDWSKEDEDNQTSESFEWLRVDADFEWICKVHLHQPDFMYHAQLQQDRDVEAQIESVRYFGNATKPTALYSSILTRTLMDERYFYGVRIEAAIGLAKSAKEENSFIGMRHLLKSYQSLYCYKTPYHIMNPINEKNYLLLPNDFSNPGKYFILKIIPKALASIRLPDGETPLEIRKILLNMLKFNDNMSNKYDDCYYIPNVIEALFDAICNSGGFTKNYSDNPEVASFMQEVNLEINRMLKLEKYLPSFKMLIAAEILKQKVKAARLGMYEIHCEELLAYTNPAFSGELRLNAFEALLTLGGIKNSDILRYFFTVCKIDASSKIRVKLIERFLTAISIAAIYGTPSIIDDSEFDEFYARSEASSNGASTKAGADKDTGMVFIEDRANQASMKSRRDAFARASIAGAVAILRRDYAFGEGLKRELWSSLHSNLLGIQSKRSLFDVCDILFEPKNSFIVTVKRANDRKIVAKTAKVQFSELEGDNRLFEVVFKREGRLKIQLPKLSDRKKDKKVTLKKENSTPQIAPAKIKILSKSSENLNAVRNDAAAPTHAVKTIKSKPSAKLLSFTFKSDHAKRALKEFAAPKVVAEHTILNKSRNGRVEVRRSSPYLPLRYVEISRTPSVKLNISTDPLNEPVYPMVISNKNYTQQQESLTINIRSEKLKRTYSETATAEPENGMIDLETTEVTPQRSASVKEEAPNADALPPIESNDVKVEESSSSVVPSLANNEPPQPEQQPVLPRPKIKLKINLNKK